MKRAPLQLSIAAPVGKSHVAFIRRYLQAAHQLIPTAPAELSLAIVDAQTIARLHRHFMNLPGPTDVLSFELELFSPPLVPRGRVRVGAPRQSGPRTAPKIKSGEVIICLDIARQQARDRRIPVGHELLLYALHGLLHLSGHDDKNPASYKKMHRTEDRILHRLGIGPVFRM